MNKFMEKIDPIIHDLKEGTLKRVAKSTYCRKTTIRKKKAALLEKSNESSMLETESEGEIQKNKQQRDVEDVIESHRSNTLRDRQRSK